MTEDIYLSKEEIGSIIQARYTLKGNISVLDPEDKADCLLELLHSIDIEDIASIIYYKDSKLAIKLASLIKEKT